jgi:CubicO group peptidase (beta-lactamase class C family)
MKRYIGAVFCLLALGVTVCVLPSGITKSGDLRAPGLPAKWGPVIDEIEKMARQTMSRHGIPGLSIALCDSHGPIWEAGFGYADDAHRVPVDGNTIFSIQSMSKTFTAVGALTAVRDGLLELDQPLSRYLPDFRVQSIFEDRPQDRITLRHLLMHTAGFTHEAPGGGNYDASVPTFDEHVAGIEDTWLMCRVGERYQYSNLGIDLAGYLVEKASGRPFIDYMQEKVFGPLHLTRTTMDPARILADGNRAVGHQKGLRDLPVIVPMTGAGGVYSSAHDLSTFLTSMLRRGRGEDALLPPRLFDEMETTPNHGSYGLGVAVGRREGDLYLTHGGGGYGFLTYMAWYPTLDIGITVLTNSADHNGAHQALAERVIDRLVEAGLVEKSFSLTYLPVCGVNLGAFVDDTWYFDAHPEKTKWKDSWKRYLGTYGYPLFAQPVWYARLALSLGLPRNGFLRVRRQGDGMAADGVPLLEQEPGLFFSKTGEALDFRSDPPTWRNVKLQKR